MQGVSLLAGSSQRRGRLRVLPCSLAVCAFASALFVQPSVEFDRQALSPADRFAVEVRLCQQAQAAGKPSKCSLYGKIKVVDAFPDVKIQKVNAFADIKVKWVDAFPDQAGKWQKVDAFPDYKIQFVDAFPDYKVQYVDAFPGCD